LESPGIHKKANLGFLALSEKSVVGPRASVFLPGKDGEAGDVCFIVDAAGCSQAENKPLEARPTFQTELSFHLRHSTILKQSKKGHGSRFQVQGWPRSNAAQAWFTVERTNGARLRP
jgi:hypothetical protein